MVVEEVQPGVFRVVDDGVRDISSVDNRDVVAGYDGSIWLLREQGFLRLGSDAFHEWPTPIGSGFDSYVLQVAPDGTLWVTPTRFNSPITGVSLGREGLRSTDGETWSTQPCPGDDCYGITVAPDGTLWASIGGVACLRGEAEECDEWVGYLGPTGWQRLDGDPDTDFEVFDRVVVTDAGDLYGVSCGWDCVIHRHENGALRQIAFAARADVGPDGTIWQAGSFPRDGLARFTDGEWASWTPADLPEITYGGGSYGLPFMVAPDGSLWFGMWRDDPRHDAGPVLVNMGEGRSVDVWCDGLARFDGEALDRFLPGRCISMDIAADGSVWVVAGDEDEVRDLYVVTPGAVGR